MEEGVVILAKRVYNLVARITWTARGLSQIQNSMRRMLDVRQWRHAALRHGAFSVSRQHRLCRWWPGHFYVLFSLACVSSETDNLQRVFRPGVGGSSPLYWPYGFVRRQRVCFFPAVLVWNRVSISTILVWNMVWFVPSSLELGMFFRRISYFFIISR